MIDTKIGTCGHEPSDLMDGPCVKCHEDEVALLKSEVEEWKKRFEWTLAGVNYVYFSSLLHNRWTATRYNPRDDVYREWSGSTPEEAVDKAIEAESCED